MKSNGYGASILSVAVDLSLVFLLSLVILEHQCRRVGLPTQLRWISRNSKRLQYRLGDGGNFDLILGPRRDFTFSPKRANRFWGLLSLLYNGYWEVFPRVKAKMGEFDHLQSRMSKFFFFLKWTSRCVIM